MRIYMILEINKILTNHGWYYRDSNDAWYKDFETIVGVKTAIIYPNEKASSVYMSEGRNILESIVWLDYTPLSEHLNNINNKIEQSYARKLFTKPQLKSQKTVTNTIIVTEQEYSSFHIGEYYKK